MKNKADIDHHGEHISPILWNTTISQREEQELDALIERSLSADSDELAQELSVDDFVRLERVEKRLFEGSASPLAVPAMAEGAPVLDHLVPSVLSGLLSLPMATVRREPQWIKAFHLSAEEGVLAGCSGSGLFQTLFQRYAQRPQPQHIVVIDCRLFDGKVSRMDGRVGSEYSFEEWQQRVRALTQCYARIVREMCGDIHSDANPPKLSDEGYPEPAEVPKLGTQAIIRFKFEDICEYFVPSPAQPTRPARALPRTTLRVRLQSLLCDEPQESERFTCARSERPANVSKDATTLMTSWRAWGFGRIYDVLGRGGVQAVGPLGLPDAAFAAVEMKSVECDRESWSAGDVAVIHLASQGWLAYPPALRKNEWEYVSPMALAVPFVQSHPDRNFHVAVVLERLADVILASSTTPPFPAIGRFGGQGLSDGGVMVNAPAVFVDEVLGSSALRDAVKTTARAGKGKSKKGTPARLPR